MTCWWARDSSTCLARVDTVFSRYYYAEAGALYICVAHSMSPWLASSTLYVQSYICLLSRVGQVDYHLLHNLHAYMYALP